jgi:AcrR family transcriptional regulator
MARTKTARPVRERILAAAFDLFYRQGYRATGINQVIAASGVAKASFYDHFPSKNDLLLAYIGEMARLELADLRAQATSMPTPQERFFKPMRILIPWFESSDYRGCPFQNIAAEAPPEDQRVRAVIRQYREDVRHLLRELAADLIAAEPELSKLDPADLADTYLLLFEGAIAAAVAYREPWPVQKAIRALEACLARC